MALKKKIPVQDKDQLIAVSVELLKKGSTTQKIAKHLAEMSQNLFSTEEISDLINAAIRVISEDYFNLPNEVKLLHLKRLDRIITRCMKTTELDECLIGLDADKGGITYKRWLAARNKKIRAYDDCLDAMQQKENLLQLINTTSTVEVNEDIKINVKDNDLSNIDLSKLSLPQKVELYNLMKKAKVLDYEEPLSVTEVVSDENTTVETVAEVTQAPANIESIEQVILPVIEQPGAISLDPTLRIREKLRMIAARKFSEAGGNMDAQEKQLLLENDKS